MVSDEGSISAFLFCEVLFHAQCFISDPVLANEDELPIENIQDMHLFLEISRKSDMGPELMVFNLKKDLQFLNFVLITADNR